MEQYFEIGKITGTHGIRGTMRVFPTTEDPSRFERLKEIIVEIRGKRETFHIQKVAFHKQFVLLTVKEITDINVAELYKNGRILISDAMAIPLGEDEYYNRDLYGLKVVTEEGEELGEITERRQRQRTSPACYQRLHQECRFGKRRYDCKTAGRIEINETVFCTDTVS